MERIATIIAICAVVELVLLIVSWIIIGVMIKEEKEDMKQNGRGIEIAEGLLDHAKKLLTREEALIEENKKLRAELKTARKAIKLYDLDLTLIEEDTDDE